MKNALLVAAILLSACGGSTDTTNGTGGSAGTAGSDAGTGATGAVGGAGTAGAAGAGIGGTAGVAGAAASGGTGAAGQCDELIQKHDAALKDAKACSLLSPASTCEFPVDRTVYSCGYLDNVNGANTAAIDELGKLKEEWKTLGCANPIVCATGGFPAQLATCKPSGQGGDSGICTVN